MWTCSNSASRPRSRKSAGALAIHRARFFEAPRPAIGVTFANTGGLPMIERIHDGFPAGIDGALRTGDIIVAVAGIQLNPMPSLARDELRPLIFSHNPYETVRLTVYRPQDPAAQARLVAEVGDARTGEQRCDARELPGRVRRCRNRCETRRVGDARHQRPDEPHRPPARVGCAAEPDEL
ncbi:MAG: PDZ domain-containing protein [Phycisphaerales bacterium]